MCVALCMLRHSLSNTDMEDDTSPCWEDFPGEVADGCVDADPTHNCKSPSKLNVYRKITIRSLLESEVPLELRTGTRALKSALCALPL